MTQMKNNKDTKSFINYIDVSFAFINFLLILFPLVLFDKNIFISIIGILLSGVLIEKAIYTFMKNNPFYMDYCYGLLICGFLFLFPSTTIFPIIGILFFPEICYIIYNILTSKGQNSEVSNRIRYFSSGGSRLLNVTDLNQSWHNIPTELNLKREKFEIMYNRKKTLLYTFVLSISLIILFMLYLRF